MSAMSDDLTLCGFLEQTGAELRFFDMGRRVVELPREDFLAFERTEKPYPQPMQQKAWFALAQLRGQRQEPVLWFVRLDLDEQAKLVQATRDYFLQRLLELANGDQGDANLGAALEDNPFTFKPRDDRLANLHALLSLALERPPSQYFGHARKYFSGSLGWDQWSFVGYQGIADLAARQADASIIEILAEAIPQLPDEPLVALCQCLENHPLAAQVTDALEARLNSALSTRPGSAAILSALLRGLSRALPAVAIRAVSRVLDHPLAADPEILATVAGRNWETLRDSQLARRYLVRLSLPDVDQQVFNHCLADLLRIPGMQSHILPVLRAPDRPEPLASAFQAMLEQTNTDRY